MHVSSWANAQSLSSMQAAVFPNSHCVFLKPTFRPLPPPNQQQNLPPRAVGPLPLHSHHQHSKTQIKVLAAPQLKHCQPVETYQVVTFLSTKIPRNAPTNPIPSTPQRKRQRRTVISMPLLKTTIAPDPLNHPLPQPFALSLHHSPYQSLKAKSQC